MVSKNSQSKLSGNRSATSPLVLSAALHGSIAGLALLVLALGRGAPEKIPVEVRVLENPRLAPSAVDLTKPPPPPEKKPEVESRKVFGATRKSVTVDSPEAGVDIKQGNTVATTPDNEKLKDTDADRLPIPIEEYLISKPPEVLESFKPKYPPEAKEKNIEGAVRVEILIDRDGRVRDARVLKGLGFGTEAAALEAARRLRFKPAEAAGQPVAVKIQFVINFELER